MKRLIGMMAAIMLVLMLVPVAVSAQVMGGDNDNVQVGAGETIDDDLYVAGQTVVIEGTVNGDVYAAGSSLTIRGTVNGDVFAAGQDVLIGGTVTGSVRAAGQALRLDNAQIGNSVSALAQSFTVESNSTIGGGMNYAAGTAIIRGKIARSLMGAASDTTLSGEIGKEAQLTGENIQLTATAVVAGNLFHYGESQVQQDQGSQVRGEVKRVASSPRSDRNEGASIWGIVWGLLALYAAGAVLLWLAPASLRGGAQAVTGRPWIALAVGAGALLVVLPLLIILMVTLVGLPLALILAVLYLIALYLAKFVVALSVGNLIARRTDWSPNAYADAAIGLILLTIIELIPVIGGIVSFFVLLLGSGGLLLARYRLARSATAPAAK